MKKTNIQTFQQAKKGPRILLPLHFNFMGKYGTNSHPVWPWLIGLGGHKGPNQLGIISIKEIVIISNASLTRSRICCITCFLVSKQFCQIFCLLSHLGQLFEKENNVTIDNEWPEAVLSFIFPWGATCMNLKKRMLLLSSTFFLSSNKGQKFTIYLMDNCAIFDYF